METFDVVVIGAGPGGEVAAGRLAEAGLSVAIVEADKVGGECSYYACMPSKALLRPSEVQAEARRTPGVTTGELDGTAILRRRDELIGNLSDAGQVPWLTERGVTLVRGWGRLLGDRLVEVTPSAAGTDAAGGAYAAAGTDAAGVAGGDGRVVLRAERAVILAGGTRAAMPDIDGLARARPWTNREATTSARIPASLVVIGGGVVGAEMSQAYATLGARVTLIAGVRGLLPREEDFVREHVSAGLTGHGVEIVTGQGARAVDRDGQTVTVTLDDGRTVSAEEVLVATGRAAQTTGLGLESLGLAGAGYVKVDDRMRVPGHEWLYVVGDLNGRALFTHMAKYQAAVAAGSILGRDMSHQHLADGPGSPRVIFTDPQVAAVGHTSISAIAAGLDVRVVDIPTDGNAGGAFSGGPRGTARFVIDINRDILVGVTVTGSGIGDFLQAATIAVVGEVPLTRLRHAIPPFPTRSELWLYLFNALGL